MLQGGETAVPPEFRARRGPRRSKALNAGRRRHYAELPWGVPSRRALRADLPQYRTEAFTGRLFSEVQCSAYSCPSQRKKHHAESSDYLNFLHYTRADSVCQLSEKGIPWHFRPDFRRFAHKPAYFRSSQSQAESAATLPSPTAFASCRGFPVQSPAANTPGTAVAMCRSTTMPPFS